MATTDRVLKILEQLSGAEKIEISAHLQNDLALDSLSMVTLLINLEDDFGIELSETDMNPFDLETVESVIRLVEKYGGDNHEQEN